MMSSECNTKQWLLSAAVLFVFVWGFDYLVHGNLMREQYEAFKQLWRPEEEMKGMLNYCIAFHAALALLVAGAYQCWRKKVECGEIGSANCPIKKSAKFGLWVGTLTGITNAAAYIWLPISQDLAIDWLLADMARGVGMGVVLALIHHHQSNCATK